MEDEVSGCKKRSLPFAAGGAWEEEGVSGSPHVLSSGDMPMLGGCGIGVKCSNVQALKPRH